MSEMLMNIGKVIQGYEDFKKLTSKQLRQMENLEKYVFSPVLPYTAKNGVYFHSNIGLQASKGFIYFRNYGKNSEGTYQLMLMYAPSYSAETKYNLSCLVDSVDERALEAVSKLVIEANKRYANNLLNC